MLKFFKIFIVVGLAIIVGCGAARQGFTNNFARDDVYLLIVNDGYDLIKVYDDVGRIATIFSGQEECVRLRRSDEFVQFSFSALASKTRWYAPSQNFSGRPGWIWTIDSRMASYSTIRIIAAEPCGSRNSNDNEMEYYHR
jgi:hypothetical protein